MKKENKNVVIDNNKNDIYQAAIMFVAAMISAKATSQCFDKAVQLNNKKRFYKEIEISINALMDEQIMELSRLYNENKEDPEICETIITETGLIPFIQQLIYFSEEKFSVEDILEDPKSIRKCLKAIKVSKTLINDIETGLAVSATIATAGTSATLFKEAFMKVKPLVEKAFERK